MVSAKASWATDTAVSAPGDTCGPGRHRTVTLGWGPPPELRGREAPRSLGVHGENCLRKDYRTIHCRNPPPNFPWAFHWRKRIGRGAGLLGGQHSGIPIMIQPGRRGQGPAHHEAGLEVPRVPRRVHVQQQALRPARARRRANRCGLRASPPTFLPHLQQGRAHRFAELVDARLSTVTDAHKYV